MNVSMCTHRHICFLVCQLRGAWMQLVLQDALEKHLILGWMISPDGTWNLLCQKVRNCSKNGKNMSKERRASLKDSYWASLGQLEYENR